MMTTATEANVHALAIEGTFDDCQALVKAMFNDLAFRDRAAARRRQLHQLGARRRPDQLLLRRRRGARRPASPDAVLRADRQLRRRLRRLCRPAHGPADGAAGDRHQRERHPAPRLDAPASTTLRDVVATTSPSMDIQVSSNFERFLFEAAGRDAAWVRGKMGGAAAEPVASASARRSCPTARLHRRPASTRPQLPTASAA